MTANEVMSALKVKGHALGRSAVPHEGKMLLNVDAKLLTVPEPKELLRKKTTDEK
jgi:hypothetical protein